MKQRAALAAIVWLAVSMSACARENAAPAAAAPAVDAEQTRPLSPRPSAPPPAFDAERAMKYLREVVAMGPRPVGSPGYRKVQEYIRAKLKGDDVEEDVFTAHTPAGELEMRNFISKYPGKKDGIIVIGGHYETLYGRDDFVGANDGGSSTAMLLELANQLRGKQREGYSVWLVWFDGEEAIHEWSETDGLYGSRHLAQRWQQDGTLKKIQALIIVDMVADRDLQIERESNSTPWLADLVYEAAGNLSYRSYFHRRRTGPITDDHVPFARRGVPVVDIIDLEYGYNNVFWHTPEDNLEKLSSRSLEIAGKVVLETVRLLDQR